VLVTKTCAPTKEIKEGVKSNRGCGRGGHRWLMVIVVVEVDLSWNVQREGK